MIDHVIGIEDPDYASMLQVAIGEARLGLAEGGVPIGAAIFRRMERSSAQAVTVAFRRMIRRFMARQTRFAARDASEAIVT